jgi:transcription elongation factor Elf1
MVQASSKMICVPCKQEMNHHADKLSDPVTLADAARVDPALGGVLDEMHTCPDCGSSQSRPGH